MPSVGPYDLIRPFLWIALVAFLCGFGGYLILGAPAPRPPEPAQAAASPWAEAADHGGGALRAI